MFSRSPKVVFLDELRVRGVFITQASIYDQASLWKELTTKSC